jgi:AraC-like DNA-binding protein
MLSFETALRLIVIGQELLIAGVFLFGRGSIGTRLSGTAFLVCVAAYLVVSDPFLRDAVAMLAAPLTLLAIVVPHSLWIFARAVFEAPWPRAWVVGAFALLAIGVWATFIGEDKYITGVINAASAALHVASLVIVGHALLIAGKGRPDDLIESRRLFRMFFVGIVALQVGVVLTVELILGETASDWLSLLNVVVIAVLTPGLAIPLLQLDPEFVAREPAVRQDTSTGEASDLSPTETVLKQALLSAMSEGAYLQHGLTIRALAEQLGYPEHQVRKLINGRLGFRNFSAFLNSYRIPEAKKTLADPGQVRMPVLTIALDLGYGSLGPFNRAFKAETGLTPTEYRQGAIRASAAESG